MTATFRVIVPVFLALAGCSTWNDQSLEEATAASIDDVLRAEMPLDEFRRIFPDATLLRGDDVSSYWVASVQVDCFRCKTADGFRRSRDTYARIVHFERNRLKTVEPLAREPKD